MPVDLLMPINNANVTWSWFWNLRRPLWGHCYDKLSFATDVFPNLPKMLRLDSRTVIAFHVCSSFDSYTTRKMDVFFCLCLFSPGGHGFLEETRRRVFNSPYAWWRLTSWFHHQASNSKIQLVNFSLSWILKQQTCKESLRANSIVRQDDVNNLVQMRLGGEFLSMWRHHA